MAFVIDWLRGIPHSRIIFGKRLFIPSLPPGFHSGEDAPVLDLDIAIDPNGNTETVIFCSGDTRVFKLVEEVAPQWRWRVLMPKGTDGVFVRLRCTWTNRKPAIDFFNQFSRKREQVLTATPQPTLETEHTGVATWLAGVQHTGWTPWNRISLTLNEDGSVRTAELVEGDGEIGDVALRASKEWKFKPSDRLPQQLTLSLASADGKPYVTYGVLQLLRHI